MVNPNLDSNEIVKPIVISCSFEATCGRYGRGHAYHVCYCLANCYLSAMVETCVRAILEAAKVAILTGFGIARTKLSGLSTSGN